MGKTEYQMEHRVVSGLEASGLKPCGECSHMTAAPQERKRALQESVQQARENEADVVVLRSFDGALQTRAAEVRVISLSKTLRSYCLHSWDMLERT